MTDADFDAKPMVLLIGQYSVGKTSFIRYLVGRDFPGMRIGPEPTTDRFVIVAGNKTNDSTIPGNALAVQADKPFRTLQKYGAQFLDKLECAEVDTRKGADILDYITFVDTPGVLSGEKQRIGRSYDFTGVVEWFAGRCDRILLLFDAHKLDISDEFQAAIGALRGNDDKIRIVLNKADRVDSQQLMRVHGALMWSLGKVIRTPEVARVYVGSFWDHPIQNKQFEELFLKESHDLLKDLKSLPHSAVVRRINAVVKRARAARIHALTIDHLRQKLPYFGKEKAMNKMLENLEDEYKEISRKHSVPLADFPRVETFRKALKRNTNNDVSNFPPLNPRILAELNEILSAYIPRLQSKHSKRMMESGGSGDDDEVNPFPEHSDSNGMRNSFVNLKEDWAIDETTFEQHQQEFDELGPKHGLLSGLQVRETLAASKLPTQVLRKLWDLADIDGDGNLDVMEFAVAKHLIFIAKTSEDGQTLPAELPPSLVPPSKRHLQYS
eukprot:CAMPEP_0184005720 /NCGR_PEP_ID=MMETSP0954-20121128/227_1 /TAXON_ID=627963 /ORGANISM="Aplanochytrium sp, Strain PBS07" /LENGTH=495 /DNA_ID=CAMNT_0026284055 /DNA_START=18 /DNA_END=1505 /DNA_ORIENTATION=-